MNEARIVNDSDKDKVIAYIKKHIKRHDHVIVGFAVETVQYLEKFYFAENSSQRRDFIKSVAVQLENTNNYRIEDYNDEKYFNDFSVSLKSQKFSEKHPYLDWFIKGLITTAIGTAAILLTRTCNQEQSQSSNKGDVFQNSGSGQQNNNTDSGTQIINNDKK